jgi:predicted nuclease of predicted toxin-antitoxin system
VPKFLVDESSGKKLSSELVRMGFDALYVGDLMRGARDEDVIKSAYREDRILVTNDKDFGELVFRLKAKSKGVILLRLETDMPSTRIKYVRILLEDFLERLENSFIVVTEDKIRIRKLG